MASVSATGTVNWPGSAQNGAKFTVNVTYNWTASNKCSVSISFSGGCDDAAGSLGAGNKDTYPYWAEGTCSVNGTNRISGMYIYPKWRQNSGSSWTNYTWSGTITKSSSFTVAYSYSHAYSGGTVKCSMTATVPYNYTPPSYTISYNANGHGTSPTPQTKPAGEGVAIKAYIADVAGGINYGTVYADPNTGTWNGQNGQAGWQVIYQQILWDTKGDGTGTWYRAGQTYSTDANLALYAIWGEAYTGVSYTLPTGTPTKENERTDLKVINISPNGGTMTISPLLISGKWVTYTFKGWFTAPNGGTQRTTNSRVTQSETVYAQYNSIVGSQESITLPTAQQITKSNAGLAGFAFSQYATLPDFLPGQTIVPTEDMVLYAVWNTLPSSTYNGNSRGFIAIYDETDNDYKKYFPFVKYDGIMRPTIPYVWHNGHWIMAGSVGEIMVKFLTKDGKNFVTSDGKIFMVRKQ